MVKLVAILVYALTNICVNILINLNKIHISLAFIIKSGGIQISLMIHTPTNIALSNNKIYVRSHFDEWQYQWPLHTHKGLEIFYFIQGQANYIIGDTIYDLLPGDMLLFSGETIHRVNPSNDVKYVRSYINFLPSFIEEELPAELYSKLLKVFENPNGLRIQWLPEEREEIKRYFETLYNENQKELVGYDYMLKSSLTQFLIHIYRKSKYLVEITTSSQPTNSQMTVQRILQYVNQIYKENESLDTMSVNLHLSKYYMCHCFKEVTGYTINSYIMRKRVDEAKRLLVESQRSINQIGELIGFNSTIHFSRTFKQYAGFSPQTFRKASENILRG